MFCNRPAGLMPSHAPKRQGQKNICQSGVGPIAAKHNLKNPSPFRQSSLDPKSLPHLPLTHKGYLDVRAQACQEQGVSEDGEIAAFVAPAG